jgi:hypothetical protein
VHHDAAGCYSSNHSLRTPSHTVVNQRKMLQPVMHNTTNRWYQPRTTCMHASLKKHASIAGVVAGSVWPCPFCTHMQLCASHPAAKCCGAPAPVSLEPRQAGATHA